jgi:integrase
VEIRLPLHLLFESRALGSLDRYPDIGSLAALPCNSEVNRQLRKLAGLCGIKKRITYHVRRHSVFSFSLKFKHLQNISA